MHEVSLAAPVIRARLQVIARAREAALGAIATLLVLLRLLFADNELRTAAASTAETSRFENRHFDCAVRIRSAI
jgi:hypothetical protein